MLLPNHKESAAPSHRYLIRAGERPLSWSPLCTQEVSWGFCHWGICFQDGSPTWLLAGGLDCHTDLPTELHGVSSPCGNWCLPQPLPFIPSIWVREKAEAPSKTVPKVLNANAVSSSMGRAVKKAACSQEGKYGFIFEGGNIIELVFRFTNY